MRSAVTRLVASVVVPCVLAAQAHAQLIVDDFNPGAANGHVYTLLAQPDGKILVGGIFGGLGNSSGSIARNFLGRLNSDGSVDSSFNPGANNAVRVFAVQPDGKILVGGEFNALGGGGLGTSERDYLGRLNSDGSLDATFNPGTNGIVYALAVQPDGKILVAGDFTTIGGGHTGSTARSRIARLLPDGSVDSTFNPGANNSVLATALQPDGKVVVGGRFTAIGGGTGTSTRQHLGRLNADGSVDTGFNPGANAAVWALAVQADGRIIAGGEFEALGGGGTGTTLRSYLGRVNADGSLDTTFINQPGSSVFNAYIYSIAIQTDGSIVAGGSSPYLLSYLPSGAFGGITATVSGPTQLVNPTVFSVVAQPSGRILVGGYFSDAAAGGRQPVTRQYIARLTPSAPPVDLNADGRGDVFRYNPTSGRWVMETSADPDGLSPAGSGFWSPNWIATPGRFNNDDLTDVLLVNATTGQWFEMANSGSGSFSVLASGLWWPGWTRQVLDLDGDGLSDVFLSDSSTGQWFKCLSPASGGGFSCGVGYWTSGWDPIPIHTGQYGGWDFFLYNRSTGQWWWPGRLPSSPATGFWAPDWQVYPARLLSSSTGDDLFLFRPSTGQWFIADFHYESGQPVVSYSSGFFSTGYSPHLVDLDADGLTDLLMHNPSTGRWFEFTSIGAGAFTPAGGGQWSLGWGVFPTDFNTDGRGDVLLYNQTTGQWFEALNATLGAFNYSSGTWSPGLQIVVGPHLRGH